MAAEPAKIMANCPIKNAPQLDIGEMTQIGADVESMNKPAWHRKCDAHIRIGREI